ncbi:MAG: hypothetical protein CMO61_09930 [Verrucomicrobiales bacterium]|nr:hypothetical protein [Verrucomicrobiales bacterium]|tara:strand:+ start:3712 stop:4200 length:489 start_codon:yes stop_codon:yes gene_type:complete
MVSLTLKSRDFPETVSDWEHFYKALAGHFTIENVNPLWPDRGAFLHRYTRMGRIEDWNIAQLRWRDYARCGGPEEKLMHGTLQLPMDVLQAAHKRLFGDYTDAPSSMAIRAIGFALFNPVGEIFDGKRRLTWDQVCRYANVEHHKRQRVPSALEDLLTELDS